MALDVNGSNFEQEVLKSDIPVLVDFWAAWCMPCKMMSPIIDEVESSTDSVKVVKINIDENPELASRYNVMSIPTIGLFKGGELVKTTVGVQPKDQIKKFIDEALQ